jgi:hypothetical protein
MIFFVFDLLLPLQPLPLAKKLLKYSMRTLKESLALRILGKTAHEAYYADTFLRAFYDGAPRPNIPAATGEVGVIHSRITDLLVANNFLMPYGNGYVITSLGKMHLDKGGYVGQHVAQKATRLSFALSLLATTLSIIAVILTL